MIGAYVAPGRDYKGKRKAMLAAAKIKPRTYDNWASLERDAAPSISALVAMARAAGLPRQFAERGLEPLWDAGEREELQRLRRVARGRAATPPDPEGRPLPSAPSASPNSASTNESATDGEATGSDGA
jgi:hypothetical protein